MHDWTLLSLSVDWKSGDANLDFLNSSSAKVSLRIHELHSFYLPRKLEWGMSVSVNAVSGPVTLECGKMMLKIEMQSGDEIEIVARSMVLP